MTTIRRIITIDEEKRNGCGLCNMVGMGVSSPAMIVVSITVGNDSLGITCLLCVALPLIISIALFLSKAAETKGIDLNTVRGDEWD